MKFDPAIVPFIIFALVQLVISTRTAVLAKMAIKKIEQLEKAFTQHLITHKR